MSCKLTVLLFLSTILQIFLFNFNIFKMFKLVISWLFYCFFVDYFTDFGISTSFCFFFFDNSSVSFLFLLIPGTTPSPRWGRWRSLPATWAGTPSCTRTPSWTGRSLRRCLTSRVRSQSLVATSCLPHCVVFFYYLR